MGRRKKARSLAITIGALTGAPVHALHGFLVSVGTVVAVRVQDSAGWQPTGSESAAKAAESQLRAHLTSTRVREDVLVERMLSWARLGRKTPLLCGHCQQQIPDRKPVLGSAHLLSVDLGIVYDVLVALPEPSRTYVVGRADNALVIQSDKWEAVIAARLPSPGEKVHVLTAPVLRAHDRKPSRFNPGFRSGPGWEKPKRVVDSPPTLPARNRVRDGEGD